MLGPLVDRVLGLELTTILLAIPAAFALYVTTNIIYNLFFHPLSKYPGPPLARITNWYAMYHGAQGDMARDMYVQHEKYGKYVRYAPNRLTINSAPAVKDIYAHTKPLKKSIAYVAMRPDPRFASTQNTIDKVDHGLKRKLLAHGFSDASMRGYEPVIMERVKVFCKLMGEGATEETWSIERDMSGWTNYLTFDVMAALVFGKPFHMLESEKERPFIKSIEDAAAAAQILLNTPWAGTQIGHKFRAIPLLAMLRKERLSGYGTLIETGARFLRERQAMVGKTDYPKDIFSYILAAKDPDTGAGFTDLELGAESRLLIVAGSDTTSSCIAAALFWLVHTPSALSRLIAELDTNFTCLSEIQPTRMSALPYLRAVIDEALRLAPPVGSALWRETQKPTTIDGIPFPAGIDVSTPIYALHHKAEYYPDPFAFKPERWIEMDAEDPGHEAFAPFSVGPRSCVGKSLAYAELYLTLSRVVYMYDMKFSEEKATEADMYNKWGNLEFKMVDNFTSSKVGPFLRYRKRKGAMIDE